MSWEKVKLGDVCVSITDGDHQSLPLAEEGIPFIVIADINSTNRIDFSKARFVPIEYYDKLDEKRKPKAGDVLLTVKGSFGIPVYVDSDKPFVFQRDIAIFKCNEKIDSLFLFYYMMNREFYLYTDLVAIGAAQRALTLNTLRNTVIKMPDIVTQYRIADILSTYDNLIENNQKQIKLLEEAAQRLYKEWFVDLRFPGYENIKIVDGVPEGWNVEKIDNIFSIKYGNTLPTSKVSVEGKYPVYGANGIIGYYSEKNCDDYTVLITSRGNGSGDVLRTHDKESFVTNNSFLVTPINKDIKIMFTYQLMKNTNFKSICTGAAQPQLTNSSISTLSLLIPTIELIMLFCEKTASWYYEIECLILQNNFLKQMRDGLLPKLMSGEIEV